LFLAIVLMVLIFKKTIPTFQEQPPPDDFRQNEAVFLSFFLAGTVML